MNKIVDIHMHVVPNIDDGAKNLEESIEMLKMSEKQGVTDVFCTSHNGYSKEDGEKYILKFNSLKTAAESSGININLHKGCEILCAGDYIDDIIFGLEIGAFETLGNSEYVLAELYRDAKPSEALFITEELKKNGYTPIIAHMERNYNITGFMVNLLISCGALIQVNAHSFVCDDAETKARARELLKNECVHFIGSDAHNKDIRTPYITSGINYIMEHTSSEYAEKIFRGDRLL